MTTRDCVVYGTGNSRTRTGTEACDSRIYVAGVSISREAYCLRTSAAPIDYQSGWIQIFYIH